MVKTSSDLYGPFRTERPNPWTLRIIDPLPLGGDPADTTKVIAVLRDASARFNVVQWTAEIVAPIEVGKLLHLHPPASVNGPSRLLEEWKNGYRYGSYYYRMGPSFITVRDTRDLAAAARYVIDDPAMCDVLLRCGTPQHRNSLAPSLDGAVNDLVGEGLLLDTSGWLVTAPFRLIRWPIRDNDI